MASSKSLQPILFSLLLLFFIACSEEKFKNNTGAEDKVIVMSMEITPLAVNKENEDASDIEKKTPSDYFIEDLRKTFQVKLFFTVMVATRFYQTVR